MAAQDDFGILSQFADWAGLAEDEASEFIKEMMSRRGHKPVTSWADGDPKDKGKGSSNVLGLKKTGTGGGSGPGWNYS